MIIISPSRGGGDISFGLDVALFDSTYSGGVIRSFELNNDGTASGSPNTVSGPGSWTWLLWRSASNYQVYCQPKSGSVASAASDPVNSWLSLGSTRKWYRMNLGTAVLEIRIRDAATTEVLATCTITLS